MSHLDEGTLHALLDGELELNEVKEIQAHLGSCAACGSRLREVRALAHPGGTAHHPRMTARYFASARSSSPSRSASVFAAASISDMWLRS